VDDLQSYVDSLNNDVPYIWDVMKSHKTTLEEKQVRRAELQNQHDSAVDSRAVRLHPPKIPYV
jgi:formiminotetrahydrofolate cyclodeaminase